MVRLRNDRIAQLRSVSEQTVVGDSNDEMKHFVMGMIAVATVMSIVIGVVLLSDVLRIVSSMICSSLDLPSPVSLH